MDNQDIASAIKESDLDNFIISIMDTADDVSEIFEKIDKKVSDLQEYLKCDAMQSILSEYSELKSNYSVIHNNIVTYSEDLINVKNIIKSGMKAMALTFDTNTKELLDKAKGGEIIWH